MLRLSIFKRRAYSDDLESSQLYVLSGTTGAFSLKLAHSKPQVMPLVLIGWVLLFLQAVCYAKFDLSSLTIYSIIMSFGIFRT
ncbi:hypothetical protein BT63DRAFT_420654 [Microthyrium microscopicum]|uniref:Uncharacterized protein n=1 Tax=Microthyrium microscopicum TaxID=703497 RepID=A0A6A6UVF3_9PEZI|nr:hypothetical protein BT63DRAFT_420654 [Microthyrium microscopicum]